MALTPIEEVRIRVQDNAVGLYFLSDDEIQYLLDKNDQNINRASVESAHIILLKLSQRGDSTVDILSIKGSKAAEQYRLALQLYLRSPDLNPSLNSSGVWAGNVSKSEMQANNSNPDNNSIRTPGQEFISSTNPFMV